MVHLNGRALPKDSFHQTELNGAQTHISLDEKLSPQRRARSTNAARGPKPLLPRSLKEAVQLAELLSKSKLIPKGFDTPETCLVGILYGMEVGLSPIAALQRMAVIDGRPTIWGDAALALVQASGLLQSIHEEVIDQSATIGRSASDSAYVSVASKTLNLKAICTVRREGRSEPTIATFSIDDAKRAGLWQKPGPWTDYPNRMLTMRARAFALRDAFPDVLAGLYIREEFVGKESMAARPERNQLNDDAEWHAASAHGAHDPIPNNADAQSNELHHVASKASEREQVITSGYGFTPDTHGQSSRADRVRDQAITSGYGFSPDTHGVSDQRDDNQSPLARRRSPPPPPEGESDAANVPIGATPTFAEPVGSIELASHVESNHLNIKSDGEVKNFLLADRRAISATGDEGADHNTDVSSYGSVDPETLLDLLDSALCCALDRPTFQEIEDDFGERLQSLSKDHRKRAQKIIDRHHKRVEDLDRSSQPQDDNQNADDMITPKLPRRLETALSHLGIGRSPSRDRRSRRKERPSQSLSSWNARRRLTSHELSDGKGVDNRDGINPSEAQTEAGE